LESEDRESPTTYQKDAKKRPSTLDFTADPAVVKVLAEGERLSFGHLVNPAFATEISNNVGPT
jgi:hypothetical protein